MEKNPLLEEVKYNTFYLVKNLFSKKMPPSVTKSSPYVKTRVDSLIGRGSYSKLFPYSYNETIQIQRPYNISVPKTLLDVSGALSLGAPPLYPHVPAVLGRVAAAGVRAELSGLPAVLLPELDPRP